MTSWTSTWQALQKFLWIILSLYDHHDFSRKEIVYSLPTFLYRGFLSSHDSSVVVEDLWSGILMLLLSNQILTSFNIYLGWSYRRNWEKTSSLGSDSSIWSQLWMYLPRSQNKIQVFPHFSILSLQVRIHSTNFHLGSSMLDDAPLSSRKGAQMETQLSSLRHPTRKNRCKRKLADLFLSSKLI